jgi:arsenite methyltransferase
MEIKDIVRAKYNQIAAQTKQQNSSSCCGATGCCDSTDYTIFSEDYTREHGYNEDADLGLGCGIPTRYASIKPGDAVLDLGSGAGNDCFVAAAITGKTGEVVGLDFAGAMITKARENARKLGFEHIRFIKGDIEEMPLDDERFHVVLSNCVLNLVPDKAKAFREIFRVLKPGGHFCISDVVTSGELPPGLQQSAEMYAGCVSGAIRKEDYLRVIDGAGFVRVVINKEKRIDIPEEILAQYLSEEELKNYLLSGTGIFSITVTGEKASASML